MSSTESKGKTRIKICGLMMESDIEAVNKYRPDYAGFIVNFPKSHRSKTPEEVEKLTKMLPPDITSVGVFVDEDVSLISDMLERGMIGIAQLHGHEDEKYIERIRLRTGKPVIKAFVVRNAEDVRRAMESPADEILLDAGLGGGVSFDWSVLSENGHEEDFLGRRFFLAGGLSAENIKEAIERVHPFAVDISSGVETNKRKDAAKIAEIIDIVRSM